MISTIYNIKNKAITMVGHATFFATTLLLILFNTNLLHAQSIITKINGSDTLIVYSNVPGLAPSPKYTIKVRRLGEPDDSLKNCFANYTYNVHDEVSDPPLAGSTTSNPNNRQNYQSFLRNWSHTFGNIEMSKNQAIEVEISSIGFNITKAVVHPAQKASAATMRGGKVYFTINNPAQIVIDINGQMDDFNKGLDDQSASLNYVAHTISLFANPVIKKPSLNSNVVRINPATPLPAPSANDPYPQKDTVCFEPGIYNNYRNFKVYPGKTYYIPGDAIVYGTFNNLGVTASGGLQAGENIKIYGYGTISGTGIVNPFYVVGANEEEYKSIAINDGINAVLQGISVIDPAYHAVNIDAWGGRSDRSKEVTFARWVKVISWRGNGDGVGSAHLVEDCFLRTADDGTYVKGNRRRCTFWKDFNAAAFHFAGIPDPAGSFPIVIEDCDVIYNRSSSTNPLAGVFVQRASGLPAVQRTVNVLIRDIRITDPRPNTPVFNLFSKDSTRVSRNPDVFSYEYGSSYSGITFQNITILNRSYNSNIKTTANEVKQKIRGHINTDPSTNAAFGPAPWYGGIIFDNVIIEGQRLSINDFNINEYVRDILFDKPRNLTLTTNADVNQGSITKNPNQTTYLELSTVTLTAKPKLGYKFTSWSGDTSITTNPLSITMRKNTSITANFMADLNNPGVIDTAGEESWVVPAGVTSAIIQVWGAGGSGGSAFSGNVTSITQAKGGGGAGGSYASVSVRLTPGQILNYKVGAGGAGAAEGFAHQTYGQNGTESFVKLYNVPIVYANGGLGGQNSSITNAAFNGAGGIASTTGNVGDIIYNGGNGGTAASTGSGGGGGSAGSIGNGGSGSSPTAGTRGANNGGVGAAGHNSTLDGNTGANPGGGGSGAGVRNSSSPFSNLNTHKTGGTGGSGKLIILFNQSGVTKTNQTITFNNLPTKMIGDADFTPAAQATSGLVVTFTSSNQSVARIVNNKIQIVGVGTAIIKASQVGNASFNIANSIDQVLTVNSNSLPISIKSFNAKLVPQGILLDWETVSETNNHYFEILKSGEERNFTTLFKTLGAGNSNSLIKYSFLDKNPLDGNNYYQLKQTDFDGTFSLFPTIKTVKMDLTTSDINFFFLQNQFNVQIMAYKQSKANIKVFSSNGSLMLSEDLILNKGSNSFNKFLIVYPGVYIGVVNIDGIIRSQKLIVQ